MSDQGEIEFLDEDADIVQQCMLSGENDVNFAKSGSNTQVADIPLLIERVQDKQERSKKKRKKDDDDSDYDPTEDIPQRSRKRRQFGRPGVSTISRGRRMELIPKVDLKIKRDPFDPKLDLVRRRKLLLRIPDFDDPLCLPVRALNKDDHEQRKLRNWNTLCLEYFKNYDTPLRVEKQPAVASKRTVVLRNLHNKVTGKLETTLYSKLTVENKNGERKSQVFQSVLPRYREKNLLNNYRLIEPKKHKMFSIKDEVIITKEVHKEVESLVVYKPAESLSLVYKIFEKESDECGHEEEDRKYLKEVASCKICAPCYQTSWRAFKNTNNKKIQCHICNRPCISMYNLLAHLKNHPDEDVRACKKSIARTLATMVEYHYKCRICQELFFSIRDLRLHVRSHKGAEMFKCEVCNSFTY